MSNLPAPLISSWSYNVVFTCSRLCGKLLSVIHLFSMQGIGNVVTVINWKSDKPEMPSFKTLKNIDLFEKKCYIANGPIISQNNCEPLVMYISSKGLTHEWCAVQLLFPTSVRLQFSIEGPMNNKIYNS